jgi:glucose-1-phosphate thymidylyltransferase
MWGIMPAAGAGSRIQPIAFSKELLPVGARRHLGTERPRAVSEYLIERMTRAGAERICCVIAPGKSDILEYYGARDDLEVRICFAVQPTPVGLCDAIFTALPFIPRDEPVVIGLPDTIWFPEDALLALGDDPVSFLLFPVDAPERFDAVLTDESGRVIEVRVKQQDPGTHWVWGAFKLSPGTLHELHRLWLSRNPRDEYFGTLVNAFLAVGGRAVGIPAGQVYLDVGTLHGYREAMGLLQEHVLMEEAAP